MKRFLVYLLVIVMTVSAGFGIFYLVRDNEVISISSASIYKDVGQKFSIDVDHRNPKSTTTIDISTSDSGIVSYDESENEFTAVSGGVARVNFRTSNVKFRNIWCDVIVGDGTTESPFYISTAEQLASIGMGVWDSDLGAYKGAEGYETYTSKASYKLVSDIDVSSVNGGYWVPLRAFSGSFDGNGYTISNVNFDRLAYIEANKENENFSSTIYTSENVGFFQEVTKEAIVYNVKFDNVGARGEYQNFGTVTALNYGVIERVDVKQASYILDTEVFGGIVAKNISSDESVDGNYARKIARVDRCNISLTLGNAENEYYTNGVIGGVVGENLGGIVAYSYAVGDVYFDATSENVSLLNVTYGGIVGKNTYVSLKGFGGEYVSVIQGANIKDCYSAIRTNTSALFNQSVDGSKIIVGGAIGINVDIVSGVKTEKTQYDILHNYIVGVYYNKELLNYIPEETETATTKEFKGLGKFDCIDGTINFVEKKTTIYGLTTEEMQIPTNFVSHYTKEIVYDEEGSFERIAEVEVLWLFDSVWGMDIEVNGGMPNPNYQVVYTPDDFASSGSPIIDTDNNNNYNFEVSIDYAIRITSAINGKLSLFKGEKYSLEVSPKNAEVTWTSGDETVVAVNKTTGEIEALKSGVTTVTAKTAGGNTDTITVIVNEQKYTIYNYPKSLNLKPGDTYQFENIGVYPAETALEYEVQDDYYAYITSDGKLTVRDRETTVPTYVFISAGSTTVSIPLTIKKVTSGGDQGGNQGGTATAVTFELNAYAINLNTYGVFQLKGLAKGENGRVTWSSSNTSVATISSNGLITAVSTETASCVVTATFVSNSGITISKTCRVNVYGANKEQVVITASTNTLYLDAGASTTVTLTTNQNGEFGTPSVSNVLTGFGVMYDEKTSSRAVLEISTTGATSGSTSITISFVATNGTTATTTINVTVTPSTTYSKYIYNVNQLNAIRYNLNREYVLAGNIDLSLVDFAPIGDSSAPFTGSIKNQGSYYISGLKVNSTYAGLFGYAKNANISGIVLNDAEVSGVYAGGIVGYAEQTQIGDVKVNSSKITASKFAGGVVGYATTNSPVSNSTVTSTTILVKYDGSVSGYRAVGGIAGYAYGSTISDARVENGSVSLDANSKMSGYAGGAVGYTNYPIKNSLVMTSVSAYTKGSDNYSGGLVGYTTSAISGCTIRSASVSGYYAGGIGGALNTTQTISLTFENYKNGNRKEDLKSYSYVVNVATTAVKDTVKVSGTMVGGLFGVINNGVVKNCYTRAELNGVSGSAVKGGFASEIKAYGFKNAGGTGSCGIVENCYSACSFSGSGDNYSVTSSLIHNYYTFGDGSERTAGYIFNYVFDDDKDGKATYYSGSNVFAKDKVKAKKSSSEMQSSSTYTEKGFSTSVWNLNGYPTLKTEK